MAVESLLAISETLLGEHAAFPTKAPKKKEKVVGFSKKKQEILKNLTKKSVLGLLAIDPTAPIGVWVVRWLKLAPYWSKEEWTYAEGFKYGPSKWSAKAKAWLKQQSKIKIPALPPPVVYRRERRFTAHQLGVLKSLKKKSVQDYLNTVVDWEVLAPGFGEDDWALAESTKYGPSKWSKATKSWLVAMNTNYQLLLEKKPPVKPPKPKKLILPKLQIKNWYIKGWHQYTSKSWNELFKKWTKGDWDFALEHYNKTEAAELPLEGAIFEWWKRQLKKLKKVVPIEEEIKKKVPKPKKPPVITPPKPPTKVDKDSCMIHLLEYRDQMHGLMTQIQQARFPKPHEISPGMSPILAKTYIPTTLYNKFEEMGYDALTLAKKCDGKTVAPIETLHDRVHKFTLETPIVDKFSMVLGGKVPHYETTQATMLKKFKRFPWMDPEIKGLALDMDTLLQRIHDAAMAHAAETGKLGGCQLLIPKKQLQKVEGWVAKFCVGVTKSHAQKGKAKVWAPNRVGIKLNNHETTLMFTEQTDETGQVLGFNVNVFDWKEGFGGHHWYRGKMVGDMLRKNWGWKCKTYENTTQCEGFLPIEKEREISGLSAFMCALNNTDLLKRKCQDHVGPLIWEQCQDAAKEHPSDLYKKVRIIDSTAQYKLCKAAGISGKPPQTETEGYMAGDDLEFKTIPTIKEQIKGG